MASIAAKVMVFTIVLHSTLGCTWHQALECAQCVEVASSAHDACPCGHGTGDESSRPASSDQDCPSCAGDCQFLLAVQTAGDCSPELSLCLTCPAVAASDALSPAANEWQPVPRHAYQPHARLHLVHQILLI